MSHTYHYRESLDLPVFREFISELVQDSSNLETHFNAAYTLVLTDTDSRIVYRAAYLCRRLSEVKKELLIGKECELIAQSMQQSHSGIRRMMLSMLNDTTLPHPIPVDFLDFCFDRMFAPQEPAAGQALCIKLAYKLCCLEPELLPELKLYLENVEKDYLSPAVRSTVKNVLKGKAFR